MIRSVLLTLLAVLILGVTIAVLVTYPRYRNAVESGQRVLAAGTIVATDRGAIEYADKGLGPPVLVVHGAGGGYDQGLLLGRVFVGDEVRHIAPSRLGYLNSPLGEPSTPDAQAELYAALLDQLAIGRVSVVAVSDGGPSALQFALRYPKRTRALVLISAKSMTPPPTTPIQETAFSLIFRSDYLFWAITEAARPLLIQLFGVDPSVLAEADAESLELVNGFLSTLNPISLRRAGIANDRATMAELSDEDYPLQRIAAPTLVIHAKDDGLQPFMHGRNAAKRIPGAETDFHPRGGHMLMLQHEEVRKRVSAFLRAH